VKIVITTTTGTIVCMIVCMIVGDRPTGSVVFRVQDQRADRGNLTVIYDNWRADPTNVIMDGSAYTGIRENQLDVTGVHLDVDPNAAVFTQTVTLDRYGYQPDEK